MKFTTLGYGSAAVEYQEALTKQREAHARVVAGGPNEVLLLEHVAVYTAGKRTLPEERPVDGTPVIDVDRGGKITWHGPGQLVGYPIIQLGDARDVIKYVRRVEDVLMAACAAFGVRTVRIKGRSGVWVPADDRGDARKIAALGIRVSRNVTMHGFAINCNNSLDPYHNIVPCGIADAGVTTLSAETGRDVSVLDVVPHIESAILAGFLTEDRDADWEPPLAFVPDVASPDSRSHPIVAASTMPAAPNVDSVFSTPSNVASEPPANEASADVAGEIAPAIRPKAFVTSRTTSNSSTSKQTEQPNHELQAAEQDSSAATVNAATTDQTPQPAQAPKPAQASPPAPVADDAPVAGQPTDQLGAVPKSAARTPDPKTELLNLAEIERTMAAQSATNEPAISPVATTPPRIPSYQESRPSPTDRPAPSMTPRAIPGANARPDQSREPLIEGLVRKATATWQRFVGSAKNQDRR